MSCQVFLRLKTVASTWHHHFNLSSHILQKSYRGNREDNVCCTNTDLSLIISTTLTPRPLVNFAFKIIFRLQKLKQGNRQQKTARRKNYRIDSKAFSFQTQPYCQGALISRRGGMKAAGGSARR